MLKSNKSLTIISLSIMFFTIVACNDISEDMNPPTPVQTDQNTPNTSDPVNQSTIKVKSIEGNIVAEIAPNGQINFDGKTLTKRQKNAEKVIYLIDGKEFAEVKSKDADGFKVRDLNGKLLWKIKIKDNKIKISDNEENENPFEIKKKDDDLKVVKNETDIGKVKFDSASKKLKIKDANDKEVFISSAKTNSSAFGVLLLDKMPLEQRLIIISELFSRNL